MSDPVDILKTAGLSDDMDALQFLDEIAGYLGRCNDLENKLRRQGLTIAETLVKITRISPMAPLRAAELSLQLGDPANAERYLVEALRRRNVPGTLKRAYLLMQDAALMRNRKRATAEAVGQLVAIEPDPESAEVILADIRSANVMPSAILQVALDRQDQITKLAESLTEEEINKRVEDFIESQKSPAASSNRADRTLNSGGQQ